MTEILDPTDERVHVPKRTTKMPGRKCAPRESISSPASDLAIGGVLTRMPPLLAMCLQSMCWLAQTRGLSARAG